MIETSQKEFENDQNRQIMQHWSNFLKNLHGKKTEDIETVLSNILEVISDLAKKGMMDIQEPETEDEKIFLNTFSVNLLKSVLSYHSKHQGIKHLQSQILEFYLDAFSRNMTNLKILPLSEQIANIFSDDNGVFRDWNGKDASETYLDSVSLSKRNGSQWEESISPGSYVDYLDKDMSATSANYHKPTGVGSWTRAMIRSIDQEGKVSLQLIGNGHIVDDIPLSSYTIAPLGTFSKDFEGRENLTTGQEIDYLDNRSWYRSTVLESIERLSTESNETRKYIKCAARIYRENGRCEDSKKRKYFGWGESFDVEISVHDPKIRRPNEFSKIIDNLSLITQYPIDSRKFNEIESYFPFDNENRFYIVPRKIEARHIDQLYFHLLNEFFIKCQGLEKILAALKSDTLNYDLMCLFIDIIYSLHSFMHITFAKTYLKEIVTTTFSNLQKFANSEVRNFKRDKFETMIKRLREMMARVYVDVELNINYELFSVDFGLACLRSSILDKKLLGIKILTDILTEITRTGATNNLNFYEKHVNPVLLMSKVFQPDKDGQNIFDVLFGSQSHSQILQKSPDLLKTFFMGRVVSNKDIDKLFKIIQESTDQEIKGVIYKGISDNTQHMGNDLLTNLINKIFEIKQS
jgi:ubiquitin carboxyl-terminal hydrolase 34